MPRHSLSLSPLNTTFIEYAPLHTYSDELSPTPTPTASQARHSPQLVTPEASSTSVRASSSVTQKEKQVGAGLPPEDLPPGSMVRMQSVSTSNPVTKSNTKMPLRRQSRFDPMMGEHDENMEDEGYGELGQKHPLRRVQEEESSKEGRAAPPEHISLPPIKSLFGVAGDTPQSQSPSSSSLFQSPSLPSLISNSPSGSPSSARTSRYSSMASSAVPENSAGWWAPEFERGAGSFFQPSPQRSTSYPTIPYVADQNDQKRRRSDGPPALRDAEESARLRWQAQSRNASYPMASSPQPPSAGPSHSNGSSSGLRSLLHPPQASSAAVSASMSRSSFSGSTNGGRLSPALEDETLPPSRRPSQASRNPSLVGGQLAGHFASLTANERNNSISNDMPPPLQTAPPERRASQMLPPPLTAIEDNRLLPPPSSLSRSVSPAADTFRRQSLTRPSSPDSAVRPEIRRASLTEIIKQKSGDMPSPANRFGAHGPPDLSIATSVAMDKSSMSEPALSMNQHHAILSAPPWSNRRESTDSMKSNHEPVDGQGPLLSLRGRKRSVADTRQGRSGLEDDADTEMGNDPGMRGMEVLLAAAAVEEERKVRRSSEEDSMDEDGNFKSNASTPNANGGANGGPKYTCAFCAKTFSRPSSLRIHTYSHTGERPYVCKEPTCRRRFSVQSNLKRHAKVHQLGASGLAHQQHQHQQHPHHIQHQPNGLPQHLGGHPSHPGLNRAPHSHSGALGPHGQMYHPQPPPQNFYPHPPHPHPQHHPHPQGYPPHPFNDRYSGPPEHYGPPPPPAMGLPPPSGPGWQSISSSRRTSKDEAYSDEEGGGEEEEEEIDELEEDD
ncbi:uncharacterized protein I303_104244 [Kwoniella dejecticola CBS 10117]|uniref:C2H2-type domain-containing protein n=1 Tax=Kwoniella dejecticola CBS 10117 TaxID=1296121 RepID=A0A1A6A5V8_9TREE|nr:uncharacterized protein I303_04780 [Kwoniella dejecticola CBS 10117]OBR85444.1 hypothetical protein I303_04780 [Kwoniella dejecticola CBS 10117]